MYVSVCGRGYNSLSVCPIRSFIRLSDQIDGHTKQSRGCSDGAKVLGKLPVPGRPTNLDNSRTRACCACSSSGWGLFGHFSVICHISFLSPSLWETARYRLKYCLKGPLSLKQPTNKQSIHPSVARLSVRPSIHIHKLP